MYMDHFVSPRALTTIRKGVRERHGVDWDVHGPFRLSPDSDHDPGRRAGATWSGRGCTWTLSSLPGQRIRLRIIVVDPSDRPVMDSRSLDILASPDTCRWTLVVRDSALMSAVQLPICDGRQRDAQIYLSVGHRVSFHLEKSEIRVVERPGRAGTPSPRSSGERSRKGGFLLTYECKC